ncbi:MAG: TonB-dependent receptor [Lutibacter sp.]|nr:TonB-dependent receptor [Lutibacter sp.]
MKHRYLFKNLLFLFAFMLCGYSYAQSVSGTVSDASGVLPGANVMVKGTSNGTTTDFDGNFSLQNVGSNAVLSVSYLGYISQEVSVGDQSSVNVVLVENASQLSEVVVVGYTTQTRGDITGSVASVDMDEALKAPMVNAAESLQGRATGVTVISNASPGGVPNISIRGLGSTGATGPLYIIDGVQTTDAGIFNTINAADIEQMNVLKDGAAAIYGARAANGVVIVTTKGGGYNMDKARITFDIYTGSANVAASPDLLNAQQHGQMLFDGMNNDTPGSATHPQYGSGASPVVPSQLNVISSNFATAPVAYVNPNGTDWWNEITRSAPTTNVSFSMANGNSKGKSYLSLGYLTREGVLKHNGFKRANIQLNTEFKANDRLTIGEHLNVSFSQTNGGNSLAIENAVRSSPLVPVYDDQGRWAGTYSNSNGLSNNENPLSLLYRAKDNYNNSLRVYGDVYLSYKLMEGLSFKTTLSGSIDSYDARMFTPINLEHGEARSFNTLVEPHSASSSWTFNNMLNYTNSFGDHSINAIAAVEAIQTHSKGNQISRTDYFNETPEFYLLSNGFGDPNVDFAYENKTTLFSLFGSVDYNYAQKYYLTATVRNDKSSRFAGDNKSGVFPSFSAGWLVNKEDFWPSDSFFSRFKVKGSWGQLGSQILPVNNPTLSLYAFNPGNSNYVFTPGSVSSGAYLSQIGNENLKWEISETTNVGVELGMLDSRLNASFEVWQIETDGLIVRDNQIISSTAPDASPPFVNIGNIKNTGFDFALDYANQTDGGFSYNVNATISSYKNEVVSLINGTPVPGDNITSWLGRYTRTEEGEPLSYFYGRVIEGFDANGRWTYKDVNGDGTVDDDDRTKIGSPHPDFTYGISFSGEYKGFDFSAFFNGSQGNDVYNHNKIFTDFPLFVNGNRSTRVLDSWTPSNTDAILPALSNSINGVEANANSYFVEDGSFFRLKNVQIGYNLSDDMVEKLNVSNVRLYVSGTNLFTITDYQGVDPEVMPRNNLNMGIDLRTYPLSKIYSVGVNVKF